jgi:hypothetical protein
MMPAPMELPSATAIPKPTPKTRSSLPSDDVADAVVAESDTYVSCFEFKTVFVSGVIVYCEKQPAIAGSCWTLALISLFHSIPAFG